ncbi:DUF2007 domain-containing protein [Planctomycetota bacterium]
MQKVYIAKDPFDAHHLKNILEMAGIAADVQGENLWGARGELPYTPGTAPSVWILDDGDIEKAQPIVSEYEAGKESGKDS